MLAKAHPTDQNPVWTLWIRATNQCFGMLSYMMREKLEMQIKQRRVFSFTSETKGAAFQPSLLIELIISLSPHPFYWHRDRITVAQISLHQTELSLLV